MVKHICEKCLKEFKQKGHLTNHLNRINPCKLEKDLKQIVNEAIDEKLQKVEYDKNHIELSGMKIYQTP